MPTARYGELNQACIVASDGAVQASNPGPEYVPGAGSAAAGAAVATSAAVVSRAMVPELARCGRMVASIPRVTRPFTSCTVVVPWRQGHDLSASRRPARSAGIPIA
jgi:hypothetical protein